MDRSMEFKIHIFGPIKVCHLKINFWFFWTELDSKIMPSSAKFDFILIPIKIILACLVYDRKWIKNIEITAEVKCKKSNDGSGIIVLIALEAGASCNSITMLRIWYNFSVFCSSGLILRLSLLSVSWYNIIYYVVPGHNTMLDSNGCFQIN